MNRPSSAGLDVSKSVRNLLDVYLVAFSGSRGPDSAFDDDAAIPVVFRYQPSVDDVNAGEGRLAIRMVFSLVTSSEETDAEQPKGPLTLSATFRLLYDIENLASFSPEALAEFAKLNGIFNAWPYWREFVQSTTGRFGVPPMVVPVFQPFKKSHEPTGATSVFLSEED